MFIFDDARQYVGGRGSDRVIVLDDADPVDLARRHHSISATRTLTLPLLVACVRCAAQVPAPVCRFRFHPSTYKSWGADGKPMIDLRPKSRLPLACPSCARTVRRQSAKYADRTSIVPGELAAVTAWANDIAILGPCGIDNAIAAQIASS